MWGETLSPPLPDRSCFFVFSDATAQICPRRPYCWGF